MLSAAERAVVKRTWEMVEPIAETAADLFYQRLFELAPAYRTLFKEDLAPQKRKLLAMLRFVVHAVDYPDESWTDNVAPDDDLFLVVLALGRRHIELYQVPDEAYDQVGAALLWTLDYGLGEAFSNEVKAAWTKVYVLLAKTMKMGRCAIGEGSVVVPLREKHV